MLKTIYHVIGIAMLPIALICCEGQGDDTDVEPAEGTNDVSDPTNENACITDFQCEGDDEACIDDSCVDVCADQDGSCAVCEFPDGCPDGEVCMALSTFHFRCVELTCEEDDDCSDSPLASICEEGLCTDACFTSADCEGNVCEEDGHCGDEEALALGESCDTVTQCAAQELTEDVSLDGLSCTTEAFSVNNDSYMTIVCGELHVESAPGQTLFAYCNDGVCSELE